MPLLLPLLADVAEAAIEPFLRTHRVARSVWSNQLQYGTYESRIFFSARGRPAPGRRWREGGWSAKSAANSRRPNWIVLGSRPVMRARALMEGAWGSSAREATYQRRWGSRMRLSSRLMWRGG